MGSLFTGIAQLVEHRSPKPRVVGSSPPSRANIETMKKFLKYCKDSWEELTHKTTWPTSKELSHSAMVVLIASIIIALVVFAIDKVFQFVMTSIYPN